MYAGGKIECDDGNRDSGDGCSSNCKIEAGYKCIHRVGQPDICIDTVPLSASLSVKKGTMLTVDFSKAAIASVTSTPFFRQQKTKHQPW